MGVFRLKIKIPKQLQNPKFRFNLLGLWYEWERTDELNRREIKAFEKSQYEILIKENVFKPRGKRALELDWTNTSNYSFNDAKLLKHIEENSNYGVIAGNGLVIIDADNEELAGELTKELDTFTVKTKNGAHFFLLCDKYEGVNKKFKDELGEVKVSNSYVVGANSIHPSGLRYEIIKDLSIKTVSNAYLVKLLKPYLLEDDTKPQTTAIKEKDETRSGLEFRRVLALLYEGLSEEEILSKMSAYSKWKEAPQQYRDLTLQKAKTYYEANPIRNLYSCEEISNLEIEKDAWLVENLIPEKAVFIVGARSRNYKTFVCLHLASCIAFNQKLFGFLDTREAGVLFVDMENGLREIQRRFEMVKRGLLQSNLKNLHFWVYPNLNLALRESVEKLEQIIVERNIRLVIFDSYRRVVRFDDKKSENTNTLYNSVLIPLKEKHNCSFGFLTHLRKNPPNKRAYDEDPLDAIIGSIDFANLSDCIVTLQRFRNLETSLVVKNLKLRNQQELKPFRVDLNWNEDAVNFVYAGELEEAKHKEERCSNDIWDYLLENNIKQIKTGEAKEKFKEKYSNQTVQNALNELLCQKKLIKRVRGVWEVSKEEE